MAYENPIIMWGDILQNGLTISGSSEATGYPVENAYDNDLNTYWETDGLKSNQFMTIDQGASFVPSVGFSILGHNWSAGGASGISLIVYESSDPSFSIFTTDIIHSQSIPNDNDMTVLYETPNTERYIKIGVSRFLGTYTFKVSEIKINNDSFQMPVGADFSFDQYKQNTITETYASSTGRIPSTGKRYLFRDMNVPFKRIPQSFVTSDLLPFLEDVYGKMNQFYFVPDPGAFFGPSEIYTLMAPNNPTIELPIYNDQIGYRNWTLIAEGVR